MLAGTTLEPLAATLRAELREMYDDWFVPHAPQSSDPAVAAAFPPARCTYPQFLRAHALVDSRAFRIDGETILAPFADMANHRAGPARNARARGWQVAGEGPRGLELCTGDQEVAAGEELCISYGTLPNWQLLLHYGFALRGNPDERVVLTLQVPEDDPAPLYTLKMLFLGMDARAALDVDHALTVEEPLPPALLASTRLLLLDEEESKGVTVATADFGKPVSDRNEAAVVAQLRTLVEAMLDGFDVFESDHEAEQGSFASFCAVYVNGQREILTKALKALEELLTSVNSHP